MWQDIVIASVSLLFGFILIPQLSDVWKKGVTLNVYTAFLTSVGLFILCFTFFTMDLWISVVAELFSGVIWFILFVLSFRNKRKNIAI